jgi:hypothetical protein
MVVTVRDWVVYHNRNVALGVLTLEVRGTRRTGERINEYEEVIPFE